MCFGRLGAGDADRACLGRPLDAGRTRNHPPIESGGSTAGAKQKSTLSEGAGNRRGRSQRKPAASQSTGCGAYDARRISSDRHSGRCRALISPRDIARALQPVGSASPMCQAARPGRHGKKRDPVPNSGADEARPGPRAWPGCAAANWWGHRALPCQVSGLCAAELFWTASKFSMELSLIGKPQCP